MVRLFQWNGVNIPYPITGLEYSYEELSTEDSGRTLDGTMDKSIVASKVTLSCQWLNCPDTISTILLTAIKGAPYGNLTYPDPMVGADNTKRFYTGNPTATQKVIMGGVAYWDIKITFIEQ